MPVATEWSIVDMKHMDSDGGVFEVKWSCIARNDSGPESASAGAEAEFTYDASSSDFTPYADLTQDQVLNWVWGQEGFDKDAIQTRLVEKVDAQIQKNATESTGLPWAVEPEGQ